MDITEKYRTRAGKSYLIKMTYNERIGERQTADQFVQSLDVIDAETKAEVSLPITAARFSTFERFTSFGSYCAINYQGVRDAAIGGLRTKVLTRVEDMLESMPS
jgi:hypothetical protein